MILLDFLDMELNQVFLKKKNNYIYIVDIFGNKIYCQYIENIELLKNFLEIIRLLV